MFQKCGILALLIGVGACLALLTAAPAGRRQPGKQLQAQNEIVQQFPAAGPAQTAWKVHWREERGSGLIIQDAFFKKGPDEPWIQIVGEIRLGEAFVPYHRGSPRFWDVSYNFPLCRVTKADAGRFGKLLSSKPGRAPTVVKEVREYGLLWKDSIGVRRGEQLSLWGTLSAANYRYVLHFDFRDDGLIRCKCGSTGHNYSGSEFEPHMHNALWRIDVNLGDPDHNTVETCEHIEPDPNGKKSQAVTLHTPFNNGREGYDDFEAEKFTMLRVLHTKKKNIRKEPWSYDLVPYRMGDSRHYGSKKEAITHHDYWVTKNNKGEIYYSRVPEYVENAEDISDTDIVIWYADPGHHEPRSEDGEMRRTPNGNKRFRGVTPIMWTTFELKPRNLWDRSPFYPYKN